MRNIESVPMTAAVSVLTVVRNDQEGLSRTIRSVLAQTYTDWNLWIKDGSSDDGTAEMATDYASNHERINIVPGLDRNLYDAMNIALLAADGRYVLFLNAGDEFYAENSLEIAMTEMEAAGNPDIGFFSTLVAMEGGASYERKAKSEEYIRYGQPAIHQATLIRREIHVGHLYDFEAYNNIADYVAIARMIAAGSTSKSFLPKLARFEVTANSSSYKNQKSVRSEFQRAIYEIWSPNPIHAMAYTARRYLAMRLVRLLMAIR